MYLYIKNNNERCGQIFRVGKNIDKSDLKFCKLGRIQRIKFHAEFAESRNDQKNDL